MRTGCVNFLPANIFSLFHFFLTASAVAAAPFSSLLSLLRRFFPLGGKMHNGIRGPSTENRGNVRGIIEPRNSTKSYISVPSGMATVTRVFGDAPSS